MEKDRKFEQIYENLVKNNIEKLENSRKKAKNEVIINSIITIIVTLVGIIIFFMFFIKFYPSYIIAGLVEVTYIVIITILYIKLPFIGRNSKRSQYEKDFKYIILKNILDSFNENITYFPDTGIDENIYKEADFEEYDKYISKDLIHGKLKNDSVFSMAYISTKYKGIDRDGTTIYCPLFQGYFCNIEFPFEVNSILYLKKDRKDQNLFEKSLKIKLPYDDMRVKIESKEFEKMFDIYASDKTFVNKLIANNVLDLFMNLKKEINIDYELTLKNNNLYIRFTTNEMFEASNLVKFSLDKNILYKYYKILDFIFKLTEILVNLID